ncbi:hypothetical protein C900_00454 [Fulvivirga imtechensis AK7]|uniref:Uncharacterized protein n=1 Tax=Fulvivirga imtechensis AK7 TaxID=1237149 RepID=L8JHR4_9BACT|nr:hypothetical protein C900_00454 [Fulvivirga imtechensis AK7]
MGFFLRHSIASDFSDYFSRSTLLKSPGTGPGTGAWGVWRGF